MKFHKFIFIIAIVLDVLQAHANDFTIQFHNTAATLARISEIIDKKEKGCYLRFGDGDIYLALGYDDSYQSKNSSLQLEMQKSIRLNHPNILKCLPLHCKELNGWEEGMFPGNHESPYDLCMQLLSNASTFWGQKITDVYSPVALHFLASVNPVKCIEFLNIFRSSNNIILIGNEKIPSDIRTLLFGANCQFIPTPSKQSYSAIDQIEKSCLQLTTDPSDYTIIVTSMGCAGRALQMRLWYKLDNVFLFDFGSLMDALCGWNTRAWIELSHFDKDSFIDLLSTSTIDKENR